MPGFGCCDRESTAIALRIREERDGLLSLGASLDHDVGEILHVIQIKAYRRWLRDHQARVAFRCSGRPRIPEALRRLVIRVSGESAPWGYRRNLGELKKLGFSIGASTIRKIPREAGMTPGPDPAARVAGIPWNTFIHANIESIVWTYFFTKPVHTLRGTIAAYVLVFIHLASRKTCCSPATYHPDAHWVVQQSRNAATWLDENGIQPRFVLQGRDTMFSDCVWDFWRSEGAQPLRTPVRASKANAFVESFTGTLNRECLN